jgi:hypothetical protein
MQGPEGRLLNVSPARKGWEIDPEDDPSAVRRGTKLIVRYVRVIGSVAESLP